ncbi:MAG: aminotransferase class I/II-fold pyridoxal phosphate-dependent enzyme [Elusimicrobia bacterium]|nr:aminotransferase class I/II-fold pyridoxal phosphate-dependent enzyme [Elusimicrobiota bacterium]
MAEDTIDRRDIDSLARWLKTYPRLSKGPLTVAFERAWSRWLGRKRSLFCNSGSSANFLMTYALLLSGRLRNRKVVVPAVGWVTSISPAIQLGMEPIPCEADPDTFGLDLDQLESLLKKHRPGAVMLVQVLGVPHKMRELMALKRKYGFFLLEDACAAVGASYRGTRVGAFGDMASFSFYFGHQMSTIEGGMVSTSDKGLHDLLLMLRSHGWSKDLDRPAHRALVGRYRIDDFHSPFVFYVPGLNMRSTDLNAYLGLGQLKKLAWIVSSRRRNHARYLERLAGRFCVQRPEPGSTVCSISFGLLADDEEQRRRIVKALVENGIETRIFSAGNLGLHPFWYERYGKASFPMADRIHRTGFFLPNNPSLKRKDVDFICDVALGAL